MNVIWSEEERGFLASNAARMFDHEIAAVLTAASGREVTKVAVTRQRQKMGIRKRRGRGVCGLE